VYKGCLKRVHKLLKNQQTVQYAELKKFTNFTSQIFLLFVPEMTANFRSYTMNTISFVRLRSWNHCNFSCILGS